MNVKRNGKTVTIDLHGMRVEDAKFRLAHYISNAPPEITEIIVIHGFNNGHALRDMIRNDFSHPRIASILKALTDGQTRLILRH